MVQIRGASIEQLQQAMDQSEFTARELVLFYLAQIALIDHCTGGLNAVLEVNPEALFIADNLDEERKRGLLRGPLHGIPILLKDTMNTADKMHTSAGSLALADNLAPYDAHVAARLRRSGAILLGKANMTEFANYMGENMPPGYSSRGGQVLSPFNRDCTPSGSSTGSAVAVAAGLCAAALGTENFGSINYPAQQNGIVGMKPTLGLVSRFGNISTTYTLDTIGPMTGCVADAAILLSCIAGRDEADPSTWARGEETAPDYTRFLNPDGLRGARIGICQEQWAGLTGEEATAFNQMQSLISSAGAVVVDVADAAGLIGESDIDPVFFYECKSCMNAYFATLRPELTCTSLQEIIEFNQQHAAQALKYGQPMLLHAQDQTSGTLTEPEYLEALANRERAIHALDELFETSRVDVLLCTHPEIIAPITGFPSMTLPLGVHANRIPFGSYWIARRYEEGTLIKITGVVERLLELKCPLDVAGLGQT